MKKRVKVVIEKSLEDNCYWGRIEGDFGIVVGYGLTRPELLENITSAWELQLEDDSNFAKDYRDNYIFEYEYDLQVVFGLFDEIKISKVAQYANLNPSLIRQYAKGLANASEKRKKSIEKALHRLGKELLEVQL